MHVKRSTTKEERQRLLAAYASASDSDIGESENSDDRPLRDLKQDRKRKASKSLQTSKTPKFAKETSGLTNTEHPPAVDEAELQLLAIATRRLDFEVTKWKQQQVLRRKALQIKREENRLREATSKQQVQAQVLELRGRLLNALREAGKPMEHASKYLALLEG